MKHHKDFDSLEIWADTHLKQLGTPSAPDSLVGNVMAKIQNSQQAYVMPDKPSWVLVWIRMLVLVLSTVLLLGWVVVDHAMVDQWWSESRIGMAFMLCAQLLVACKDLLGTLMGAVPYYVWIGLAVSWTVAYGMMLIAGTAFFHFTSQRNQLHLTSV